MLYALKKKTSSPLLFSCPPYSKCIKKSSNFDLHQLKIFLVFGFSLSYEWNSYEYILKSTDFLFYQTNVCILMQKFKFFVLFVG